jgi:N-acyl-D-aspartate/D-glutamate deacylase
MDPETRLDSVGLNIGIRHDSIAIITGEKIRGKRAIDASGLVVAPGFIDILSYDPNSVGVWNKIADGVTTTLAMHGGTSSPLQWYSAYERQRPPVHFGASFFYTDARNRLGIGRHESTSKRQIEKLLEMAEQGLQDGCLGISFSLEYVPGISPDEIVPQMRLAAKYDVPVFFHGRYSDMEEPGTNIDALNEIIGYAWKTGASVHIAHINSTGGTFSMRQSLALIDSARSEGLEITACVYPYAFWATYLNSARYDAGWQKRFRISYGDLQVGGSAERLTGESFKKYRTQRKLVVAYAIPEEDVIEAFRSPYVMIASDAILEAGFNNHPRASGTFARVIGRYVREQRILPLMDALEKMTILPARRMEQSTRVFKKKGRLSIGADADIAIFDYETISDRATVEHPERESTGVHYVIVGGMVVRDPTGNKLPVRNGKPIRREPKAVHYP